MAAVSVVVSPGKEHAKVVVHLQTRPGFPDDRRVGGGTVTGPRDHLLSVDQIRLVKEARGPPTSLGRVPGSELCALVCVPDWVVRVNMKGPCKEVQKNEDQEGEAAATGPQAETLEAKKSWTANSHSALETEDVDLSENQIGAAGLQAICTALTLNPTVQKMQLQGNRLEEKAAQHLAALLLRHTGLKSLDLSYNQLNDLAGETLGPAVAENTGLTELNLSWNHLRGLGAIAFARGLEANIFLKVLDISHNGFGDSGACAVGEALRVNNVLEELNMRNNRISTSGALKLGLGLQVNQTLRVLIISKNPICSDGCVGLLKSVRSNKSSGLELLDVSGIQVSRECDELASSMSEAFPGLCIKHCTSRRKDWPQATIPAVICTKWL
ncbi:leucine-rich repeat-containing protein 74B isoform X2 [Rattus norvegicus]